MIEKREMIRIGAIAAMCILLGVAYTQPLVAYDIMQSIPGRVLTLAAILGLSVFDSVLGIMGLGMWLGLWYIGTHYGGSTTQLLVHREAQQQADSITDMLFNDSLEVAIAKSHTG